jgi:hypothetical protein
MFYLSLMVITNKVSIVMTTVNPYLSIITLNVSELNSPIKTHSTVAKWKMPVRYSL